MCDQYAWQVSSNNSNNNNNSNNRQQDLTVHSALPFAADESDGNLLNSLHRTTSVDDASVYITSWEGFLIVYDTSRPTLIRQSPACIA